MLIQLYIEYIRIYTSRYDAAKSHVHSVPVTFIESRIDKMKSIFQDNAHNNI